MAAGRYHREGWDALRKLLQKSRAIFANGAWKEKTIAELEAAFANPPPVEKPETTKEPAKPDKPKAEAHASLFPNTCGLCGARVGLTSGVLVKNGLLCDNCVRRVRKWYPIEWVEKKYRSGANEDYDEWRKDLSNWREIDPLKKETLEALSARLNAENARAAQKAAELKAAGTCSVVLMNVRMHCDLSVSKALTEALGISPALAREYCLHTPIYLKEDIPYDEAKALRDKLIRAGAEAELREA